MNTPAPPSIERPRPPRLWPVIAFGALIGGAGLVRLVIGLVRMAGPEREHVARSVAQTFSLTPLLAFVGIKSAILLGISLVAGLVSGQRAIERLRLGPSGAAPAQLALATVATYCLGVAGYAAASLVGADRLSHLSSSDRSMAALPAGPFVALLLAYALGGAIEEIFYRGFIQTRLSERWGRWPAIVTTAAAFGLAHSDLVHSTLMILMGLLLGWLVETRRSIRPAIVAHAGNNVISCLWTRLVPNSPSQDGHAIAFAVGLVIMALCLVPLRDAVSPAPGETLSRRPV